MYNLLAVAVLLSFCQIYEAKKCYVCHDEKCIPPLQTMTCGETDQCFTIEVHLSDKSTIIEKGCLPTSKECDEANTRGDTDCTSCNTELCNAAVEECHFCDGSCSYPLATQKCGEVLNENDSQRMCLDAEMTQGDEKRQFRRCITEDEIDVTCSIFDKLGGTCNVCSTSLCNDRGNHSTKTIGSTILISVYLFALYLM